MVLDGREGDDERVRDLAVLAAGGREIGDPALARRERGCAGHAPPAGPGAGGTQLAERTLLERRGAAAVGEVDGDPERLAGLEPAARAEELAAELGVGARSFEQPDVVHAREHDGHQRELHISVRQHVAASV